MGEGGCTDSAFADLKLISYFLICEQAPPNFYFQKIIWEQISVVGQCTVRLTLLRQSNFDRRVFLKLFGTLLF